LGCSHDTTSPAWELGTGKFTPQADYKWELYNTAQDYSEYNDLAVSNPDKLKEMQALFLTEAAKYQVLPLDNSGFVRLLTARPSAVAGKTVFTYTGESSGIPVGNAPSIIDKDYTIIAEVTIPEGGGEGMIPTLGGRFGGYGLFSARATIGGLGAQCSKLWSGGLFLLGLLVTRFVRKRGWSGWKTWPGYALLLLAPVWLVAGLITGGADRQGQANLRLQPAGPGTFQVVRTFAQRGQAQHHLRLQIRRSGLGKGGTGVLTVDGKR
jgi:hypothetical protein